jgi:3-oxoacyl-[acyl-carrier-protein] synthase II
MAPQARAGVFSALTVHEPRRGDQVWPAGLLPQDAQASLSAFDHPLFDRATQMALVAASEAVAQSAAPVEVPDPRAGVYWGIGMGGAHTMEGSYDKLYRAQQGARPMTVVRGMANAAAGQLSARLQFQGPSLTFCVACASSAVAIGEALTAIQAGRIDRALVGGSEALLVNGVMNAWLALKVLAPMPPDGNADMASRPFDLGRTGFVMSEGAAALMLERADLAQRRGVQPLARLAGYGLSCDAQSSMVLPVAPTQADAMRQALAHAGLQAKDIGYVNAHATGTDAGDVVECQALHEVFGAFAIPPAPTSATKSWHGHLLGAAGAYEAVVSIGALRHQALPPTANLLRQDPRCRLDAVANQPRPAPGLSHVMSNSFAFGGVNAALVFSRADGMPGLA